MSQSNLVLNRCGGLTFEKASGQIEDGVMGVRFSYFDHSNRLTLQNSLRIEIGVAN